MVYFHFFPDAVHLQWPMWLIFLDEGGKYAIILERKVKRDVQTGILKPANNHRTGEKRMENYESIESMAEGFENLPYHKFIGLKFLEAGESYAELMLPVKKETINGNGVLHGGMYYTLCDLAASAVLEANSPEGHFYATHDINVSVLASVSSGTVKARAELIKSGKRLAFVEVRVYNDKEELLAVGRLTKTLLVRKAK
ncbi:MAG: PaaI family thioesterase [Firmicutes bacterium]|nr:PaaI family thioesterase [Bacillota bacterium]